jgi:hypothetical protein
LVERKRSNMWIKMVWTLGLGHGSSARVPA